MTVQTNTNVASFNGNGVTQIFPIAFKFNNDTDLVVLRVDDATGDATLLTLNSDYTVSGEGDEEGGLINIVLAPAVGQRIKVTRVVDILQLTDLRNQGKFFAEVHEDAFDLLTMIAQQHQSEIGLSLRVAETDPAPGRIPPVAQRANMLMAFDSNGNPTTALPVADSSTALRQELAAEGGSSMIGRGVVAVESIADLLALPADQRRSDLRYLVASYHGGWAAENPYTGPVGGGEFYYDSALATENNGGTVIEGFVRILAGPVCPTMFGAKGDGVSDDGAAFQAAVDLFSDISVARREYNLGSRAITIPRDKRISFNDSRITRTGTGIILDLVDALYVTVRDVTIVVPAGCTGVRIDSTGTKADSQLNRFYNVNTEGNFSAGSVSLQLLKTWTNQFYSCNFFRTQTGLIFGASGIATNSCNANHFFGCEVRSDNTYADHTPVIHYGGDNNAFFGGVIENWANSIDMQGGTFLLKGVYLEGFAAAYSIEQSGGRLSLDGCFRQGSTRITGGLSFSIRDHHFVEPAGAATYTAEFPFIRVDGNLGISVNVDVDVNPTKVFVIREGYYRESGAWFVRTAGYDKVRWHQPKFSARLASDLTSITGDGTAVTVNFGNNMEFNDTGSFGTAGVFTAPVAGRYKFGATLWISGCAVGDTVDLRVTASGRYYQLYRQRVTTGMLDANGRLSITGSCFANLAPAQTAVVTLTVSGQASKTVGVLRGDAINVFSGFHGFKV